MTDKSITKNIALLVSYDGREFAGFQIQKEQKTVQQELEQALSTLHHHPVRIAFAGRTDSGVSAVAQVINFKTSLASIPLERYPSALGRLLPGSIRIRRAAIVDNDFHSRFNAQKRCYHYRLSLRRDLAATDDKPALYIGRDYNVVRLNQLAAVFIGKHDFTAFAAAGDKSRSKVRTIYRSHFYVNWPYLIYQIEGNAFLWRMVRSIVGTLLMVYNNGDQNSLIKILNSGKRLLAGTTAPAEPLTLQQVVYDRKLL